MEPISIEQRLDQLEAALGKGPPSPHLSQKATLLAVCLAGLSIVIGSRGFGLPNHPYQVAAAALAIALGYHRAWIRSPGGWRVGVLALLNTAQVSLIFKLFIGSGRRYPFFWLKLPVVNQPDVAAKSWFDVLPKWNMAWEPTALTTWDIDFTVMQTFLLAITLVGALFRFQPFVSLTALALIFASIPAFMDFQWNWVFPAMAACAISLYVQSSTVRR